MGTMILKHRPTTLKQVVGNEAVKKSLEAVLNRDMKDMPKSFFFSGPSGCGKTTLAKVIAQHLNITEQDLGYYNAANTRGIDTVRAIIEAANFRSHTGGAKMFILDESHSLTPAAQESLLLLLENPPENVFIVLCTTEPEKLKTTIKNRCQQYEVKALGRAEMDALLKRVTSREKKEVNPKVISMIIKAADGSPRHALSLLDSIIDLDNDDQAMGAIESSSTSETAVIEMCRLLMKSDSSEKAKFSEMKSLIAGFSGEPESARRAILGYLTACLVKGGFDPRIIAMGEWFEDNFYDSGKFGLVKALYGACGE